MILRKCNNFLIWVGMLLLLSCLAFSLAYASTVKEDTQVRIRDGQGNKTKNSTIHHQQRKIKNSLRRMEDKIKKRKKKLIKKKNNDNI